MSDRSNRPSNINLEFLRKEAKALLKQCRAGDPTVLARMRAQIPPLSAPIKLADVQHAVAREHGYSNWAELKRHDNPIEEFLVAIRGAALQKAKSYLEEFSEMAAESIHAACAIGDSEAVARHLQTDAGLATAERGGWPPLIYACASPLNRLSTRESAGIGQCVKLLLDAGVDPNFSTQSDPANPQTKLSATYRALANANLRVVIMLRHRGGGAGDDERLVAEMKRHNPILFDAFHEFWRVPGMRHWMAEQTAEFRTQFRRETLSAGDPLRFIRRETPVFPLYAIEMFRFVVDRGYDLNQANSEGDTMLHGNARIGTAQLAELLLSHGADLHALNNDGRSALAIAVRAGNEAFGDVLRAHGGSTAGIRPIDELLGACLRVDAVAATSILKNHPDVLNETSREDFEVMIQESAVNNVDRVRLMAQSGFDLAGRGEGGATALHVASWHGHIDTVRVLLESHAPINDLDTIYESTPLAWASHGSVHNHAFLLSRPDAITDYRVVIDDLRSAGGMD